MPTFPKKKFMKKVFSLIVFIALGTFWGCNSSPDLVVFPAAKKITLSEFDIADVLAWPDNLLIRGEHIILYDAKTDWVFKIFSKEGFEFEGNLLRRGRGPLEEVQVTPFSRSHGEDAFLFQGLSSVKLADVQHDHNELKLVVIKEFALPTGMYDDYDVFLLNDKVCSANTFLSPKKDFRCFDLDNDSVYEWGELIPLQRPESLGPQEVFFIGKHATVSPDGNLLAVAYQNLPILRIYESKTGQILHQLHVAEGSYNEECFEKNSFKGFITYYGNIKSTNEYIYALYRGDVMSSQVDIASVLHVWKWDGTPVMTLELDRPIYSFDITEDNKQIIASSVVDVDRLFVADIPWSEED